MKLQMSIIVLTLAVIVAVGCGSEAPTEAPVPADAVDQTQAHTPSTPVQVVPATEVEPVETAETPPPSAAPAPVDEDVQIPDVVARIGDFEITGEDFQRQLNYAKQVMQRQGMAGTMPSPSHEKIVRSMVDSEILTILASKEGSPVTDEELQAKVDERKAAIPEQYYTQWLESQGLTEESLKELIRRGMLTERFVEEKTKHLEPTEDEIVAEYEKLKAAGRLTAKQDTADVAHILIKAEGEDEAVWEAAKERIDAARARIVAGEAFADVANEVSEDPGSNKNGGAYPGTPSGRMVPEFDKRMASVPINEVTEPFRTDFGWHILTVTDRTKAGSVMPMEDVREGLTRSVMAPKQRDFLMDLVAEAKKTLDVEIFYPVLTDEAEGAGAAEDVETAEAPADAEPASGTQEPAATAEPEAGSGAK